MGGKTSLGTRLKEIEKYFGFETDIKWGTAAVIFGYHALAFWWSYHYAFPVKWQTIAFAYVMYVVSGVGITAGVHRYWSHRSFQATRPLQCLLLLMFATSGQTSVLRFVRNHRMHHKYSDTPADPHNAGRGLFFSHIGWLMMTKSEDTVRKGKALDYSDITEDPLLMWYERNLVIVNLLMCFVIPTALNVYLWEESWACALAWQAGLRYLYVLHWTLAVNSLAHKFGHRPYNRSIKPVENILVTIVTMGEGFHNYHHSFPFDYKGTDVFFMFNAATIFINGSVWMGLAYGLKEAPSDMVKSMAKRMGDGFWLKAEFEKE